MRLLHPILAAVLGACICSGCDERRGTQASAPAPSASAVSAAASADSINALVSYLRDAEIQVETDAQRRELRRALTDLQTLPAAELRAARYAGADGQPARRDVVQVLRAHLVPATPRRLDMDGLLADSATAEGRNELRETVTRLDFPTSR